MTERPHNSPGAAYALVLLTLVLAVFSPPVAAAQRADDPVASSATRRALAPTGSPTPDISVAFKCVSDSARQCIERVFPGQPWRVRFGVYNQGDTPISNWSYDVVLTDQNDNHVPIATQVPGDSLFTGAVKVYDIPGPRVFDESESGTIWEVAVTVRVKDPLHPEPPERQGDNQAFWNFRVDSPTPDLSVAFTCVMDSSSASCSDHLAPSQPFKVMILAHNSGESPISSWSFDIDLVDLQSGARTPLKTQVTGDPIPLGQDVVVQWPSPIVFDPSQNGRRWRVDVVASIKDPLHPEPSERLYNNQASWEFRVEQPVSDIFVQYKCVTDSIIGGCAGRIFPDAPWRVNFTVQNVGEVPLNQWSYDIDLVNLQSGEHTLLATQVPGDALPVGYSAGYGVPSPRRFQESEKGTTWRVVVRATVKDPLHPETPERQLNNQASWDFRVENPLTDLTVLFKCVADTIFGCRDHVFPGVPWGVHADVYNFGEVPIADWSYDIELVDLDSGEHTPVATQVPGDPLPQGGYSGVTWRSPTAFDESQKGRRYRAVFHVTDKDPLHPEPPDRLANNQATWDFQVQNPVSDIRAEFKCVSDSNLDCHDRVFPGAPWGVVIVVSNPGELPLTNWSYDLDLVNVQSGDRVPLQTQVSGDTLGVGQYAAYEWHSPTVFDESQKGTSWRVEMRATVKDPLHPEPAERQADNQTTWTFQVVNPFSDVSLQYKCVRDTFGNCRDRVFPGQPWRLLFVVYNQGEVPLTNWSYDVDLINRQNAQHTPLLVQVAGDSMAVGDYRSFEVPSPMVFDESQKGIPWAVEMRATVKDPLHPEPPERQFNNRASWEFRVENPISDIRVDFKCPTDTTGINCRDRIFPGQPWSVYFRAANGGEVPLTNWSYNIELFNPQTLEHVPVVTQVAGDSLPVGSSTEIRVRSPIVFSEAQKGTTWRAIVRVTVKDPLHPEPPDRQLNNETTWEFRVENPLSDIALSSKCVVDPARGCVDRVFPGQTWHVSFSAFNNGETPLTQWSYDINLINLDTNQHVPLWTQVSGSALQPGQGTAFDVISPMQFDEGQKGSHWQVEVLASIKDPQQVEPPGRLFDNRITSNFQVENRVADLAVQPPCLIDSLVYGCRDRMFVGHPWKISFQVNNPGEVPIANWSYDIDLINLRTAVRRPLYTQVAGDPILVNNYAYYTLTSPVVFDESEKDSSWRVEIRVTIKDPLHPEPPDRLYNNLATTDFRVVNPAPDLAALFKCVSDTSLSGCHDRVFPGVPWTVGFQVANYGESPIGSWRYTIELINSSSGEHTPIKSLVAPDSLAPGEQRFYASPTSVVFDENQKGTTWRVHLHVTVEDSLPPEPADRQGNNDAYWDFRIENPVPDIALGFKCVGDSAATYCSDRVFPGRPWHVYSSVYNAGDLPLVNWSYDIDLVDLQTGARTPLAAQVAGDSLPVNGYLPIDFISPVIFVEGQKGNRYRVEARATVKDPLHPEPPDRQTNNAAAWEFRVVNPVADLAMSYKCVIDTTQFGNCRDRVFPGQSWQVIFYVYNAGDLPIVNWSYDIDLVNLDSFERTPLKTQVPGDTLPVSGSRYYIWPSPVVFDETQKGSHWRVEVRGTVKDPLAPELPDQQSNNLTGWEFRVENPVPSIVVGNVCATQDSVPAESLATCRDVVFSNAPWGIQFYVGNSGETPLDHWSFDVTLRRPGVPPIPLKTQVAGPPLAVFRSMVVDWPSPRVFNADETGPWTLEVVATIKDTAGQDTTRRGTTVTFFVQNRIVTPTLLSLFRAEPVDNGIELRWQFSEPREIASVTLQRAPAAIGPWLETGAERHDEEGATVTLDRDVQAGATYQYRLVATTTDRRTLTFGPVTGTAGTAITAFELTRLSPNPSTDLVRIDFTLPRQAHVRLRVMDVLGREMAVVAEGVFAAGRHQATWRGDRRGEPAPPGLYFVRYETPERSVVRRLVRMR